MKQTTIAQQLQQEGFVLTHSMGVSMQPMLKQQTEQLLIEKPDTQPRKGDVVLFCRSSGQYVLHRVIRVEKGHYLILGDNCYGKPEKVKLQNIIGILKGFYRGNNYIDCRTNRGYRVYSFLWRLSYPIRFPLHHCLGFLRRVIKRLRR